MELVSVIVPIYKVEEYVRGCIESICAQTYRNLEIILVDDGSPDGCGAICDTKKTEDWALRVIQERYMPQGNISCSWTAMTGSVKNWSAGL